MVAPPDAVAATAVGRRVGLPRRHHDILEGESLVNDATALVALTATTAAITSTVTPLEVGWDFVLAAGGGLVVGLAATSLLAAIRRRINDPVLDTTLSFTAPFVAFLPAEAIDASGVVAVVVTGLLLGHKAPTLQSAASRLAETTNWRTVQFMLENAVFLLIGLQIQPILEDVADTDLPPGGSPWSAWRRWSRSSCCAWSGSRGAYLLVRPVRTPRRARLELALPSCSGGPGCAAW